MTMHKQVNHWGLVWPQRSPLTVNPEMCFATAFNCHLQFWYEQVSNRKMPILNTQLQVWWLQISNKIYLEAIYWKLFITGTLFTLCNIPITKEELSWKWLANCALLWCPFGKTPFCNAPRAMKTFQISSDDQWWVTYKAIWIPLQGEFNFRFRCFFF